MVYADPLSSIVKKLRANTTLTALIPASHIHVGYPPDQPQQEAVYISQGYSLNDPILSSANQNKSIMMGVAQFHVDAFSAKSIEDADLIRRYSCEAALPSLTSAGIFSFKYTFDLHRWAQEYLLWWSNATLIASCREWIAEA